MDNIFVAEMVGTAILILLGDGGVANVLLKDSKGEGSGWIVITAGWAFAVAMGVYAAGTYSGAHLNPAVTIGLAVGEVAVEAEAVDLVVTGQPLAEEGERTGDPVVPHIWETRVSHRHLQGGLQQT